MDTNLTSIVSAKLPVIVFNLGKRTKTANTETNKETTNPMPEKNKRIF